MLSYYLVSFQEIYFLSLRRENYLLGINGKASFLSMKVNNVLSLSIPLVEEPSA